MPQPVQILSPEETSALNGSLAARGEAASIQTSGALFFGDDLTHDIQENFRVHRPTLTADRIIHMDGSVPFVAREVRYRQITGGGQAKWFDGSSGSLGKADVGSKRVGAPMTPFGVKINWDFLDQEAIMLARANGVRLPDIYAELVNNALRAIAEFGNRVAWFGDAARGYKGLLAQPFEKPKAGVHIGEGTSSSGKDIAKKVLGLFSGIERKTKSTLRPNACCWSIDAYLYAEDNPWNPESSDLSILEYIQKKRPDIMHERSFELDEVKLQAGGKTNNLGSCIVAGNKGPMTSRLCISKPRFFGIVNKGGGMAFEQNILANVSDVIMPQGGSYAMLTNCDTPVS